MRHQNLLTPMMLSPTNYVSWSKGRYKPTGSHNICWRQTNKDSNIHLNFRIMKIFASSVRRQIYQLSLIAICFLCLIHKAAAHTATDNDPRVKEIVGLMNSSAEEWDKGNLTAFVEVYEPSATMMMPGGTVG